MSAKTRNKLQKDKDQQVNGSNNSNNNFKNIVSIITDSTTDLPKESYKGLDLTVIPLSVTFNDNTYLDNGIDISPQKFYEMMSHSTEMPRASQPTPGSFLQVYDQKIKEGKEIISIHISRKLSGTLNSAELAANQIEKSVNKKLITIFDSELVHMACGFLALKAANLAKLGLEREKIILELKEFRKKIFSFFIPKSLDNLIKGGRINKIKGTFASALEIKPILTLKDGEVSLYKNTRKWEIAKREIIDSMQNIIDNYLKTNKDKSSNDLIVSIGDVANDQDAVEFEDKIKEKFNPKKIIRTNIGIVVGSHLGIGGLSVTFYID